jgi:hypothetical protein
LNEEKDEGKKQSLSCSNNAKKVSAKTAGEYQ